MFKNVWALAAASALAVAVLSGCSSGNGVPTPGEAKPGDWCNAADWIDRASYDYGYWQEQRAHEPADVERAMGYGHTLRSQLEQDKRDGKLPADVDDKLLTAWMVNLAHVQGQTPITGATTFSDNNVMDSYIDEVHGACN